MQKKTLNGALPLAMLVLGLGSMACGEGKLSGRETAESKPEATPARGATVNEAPVELPPETVLYALRATTAREAPRSSAEEVLRVDADERIRIVAESGGWYRMSGTPDGVMAWIHEDQVRKALEERGPPMPEQLRAIDLQLEAKSAGRWLTHTVDYYETSGAVALSVSAGAGGPGHEKDCADILQLAKTYAPDYHFKGTVYGYGDSRTCPTR